MIVRSNPETAAVIIGSLGKPSKVIYCKLGHSVGRAVIIEAVTTSGRFVDAEIVIVVIAGDRNKGMMGMESPRVSRNAKVFNFGSNDPPEARNCRTERT